MIAVQNRQERIYGPVDYLLTGIYACLAAYSTGMSVGSAETAWMFVGIIAAGTLFSFAVQWLVGDQPVVKYDGLMYLLVGVAVVFFRNDLSKIVPDQPFQDQLLLTGTFTWLLALGSFFTWRDGTLLFQAVPSIALFGMVGIFDTFKATPFLFFGLLLCLATLFARAHRRQMIEQAEASGYKAMLAREEAESAAQDGAVGGARLEAILEGPWKWMAGPEWALASALVIVMISLLGAPALHAALKPFEGSFHIPPPPLTTTQANALLGRADSGRVYIGEGPVQLGTKVVLTAATDEKRYLRARTYSVYDNFGWEAGIPRVQVAGALAATIDTTSVWQRSVQDIKNPVRVPFVVTVLDSSINSIPVPGDIADTKDISAVGRDDVKASRVDDGTFIPTFLSADTLMPPFSGYVTVSSGNILPKSAPTPDDLPETMQPYFDTTSIPQDVQDLAKAAVKGKKTDYDKALAIQHTIEGRCMYNLKAGRTPANTDPVEYFLFTSHQGYCDLFASSMTLMARSVGIPARYVTGFYPIKGTLTPDKKAWSISEAEAHAWSELYFNDVGWVPFDATEGAAEVPGEGLGDSTIGIPFYQRAWFENALDGAIILILIGGALYASSAYRRYAKSHVTTRHDVGREYARFVNAVQKKSGRRRLPSQTPSEYLAANKGVLGDHEKAAEELTSRFIDALYSPAVISDALVKELHEQTDLFRQELMSNGNGKTREPAAGSKK